MKKRMTTLVGLLLAGTVALAAPDTKDFSCLVSGTGTTNQILTIRGTIESIKVTPPTGCTGTVTVATSEQTVFSKSGIAAAATFTPRVAIQTSAGVAATFVGGTNDTANAWYDKFVAAGPVTATVVGASPSNGTWTIRVTYMP